MAAPVAATCDPLFRLPLIPSAHICPAEDSGRRKRESLYGYDDNGEPLAGSSADGSASGAAPEDGWQGDWQPQGGNAQPPSAAAWDAQQQVAWDAAAAFDAAPRRRRRERSSETAGSSEARTSRLGRRRHQRLEQQQAEEQQWLAEQEQQEQQQRSQRQAASQEGNPWVEAELRQLRRRQAAREDAAAGGAAGAAAGVGKLPDPWAQEWGPLQGARAAAAAQDWGWGAESWAGGTAGTGGPAGRQQRREETAAADPGPGSSWDLRQQQRELRRRRRWAAGGDDEDEEAAGVSGQQAAYAAAANGAQPRYGVDYDAELEGLGPEDEEYLEDNWGEAVPPGSDGWRGRAYAGQGAYADGQDGGQYSQEYQAGLMTEPDIALLSEGEGTRAVLWGAGPLVVCGVVCFVTPAGVIQHFLSTASTSSTHAHTRSTCAPWHPLMPPTLQRSWSACCRWCPPASRPPSFRGRPQMACSAGEPPWHLPFCSARCGGWQLCMYSDYCTARTCWGWAFGCLCWCLWQPRWQVLPDWSRPAASLPCALLPSTSLLPHCSLPCLTPPGCAAGGHLAVLAAVVALGSGRKEEHRCAPPAQVGRYCCV